MFAYVVLLCSTTTLISWYVVQLYQKIAAVAILIFWLIVPLYCEISVNLCRCIVLMHVHFLAVFFTAFVRSFQYFLWSQTVNEWNCETISMWSHLPSYLCTVESKWGTHSKYCGSYLYLWSTTISQQGRWSLHEAISEIVACQKTEKGMWYSVL